MASLAPKLPVEKPAIGIVIPCYNEEAVLAETSRRLDEKLESLIERGLVDRASRVYFVDDGSTDSTWDCIMRLAESNRRFIGIKLTRNHGHQRALYAGLMNAEGDALVSIDADLQDDINAIDEMVEEYLKGNEIVYGVRDDRLTDSRPKRWTASLHYWVAARFGIETIPNHADFRLMSKRAVMLLGQFRETTLYLRGVVPTLGLQSSIVYYARGERFAGESKYGIREMFGLSVGGLTSFSIFPLRFISALGTLVFVISMLLGIWALHAKLTGSSTAIDGWASTVIPVYLLGGLQLLAIGVAGEYIGKTYMQVKNRPLYMVEEIYAPQRDYQAE